MGGGEEGVCQFVTSFQWGVFIVETKCDGGGRGGVKKCLHDNVNKSSVSKTN